MCLFENVDEVSHPKKDVQKHIPVEPWGKKSEKNVEFTYIFSSKRGVTVTPGSQLLRLRMGKMWSKNVWNVNANRHPKWRVQKHISEEPWSKNNGKIVEFSQTISLKRGVTVTPGLQLARLRMEKNVLAKQCTTLHFFEVFFYTEKRISIYV